MNYPTGIQWDNKYKCLYFVNSNSNQVLKKTATGITSIAGTGTPGWSGDGGLATNAKLNGPLGIALDTAGNVYIADFINNLVRKVNIHTGIIERVAGDSLGTYNGDGISATSADLFNPAGVAVDDSGNVYIADQENNRIRKVESLSGIIYTIAGNGTAGYNGDGLANKIELNSPADVVIDKNNNIYIADQYNNLIRKLNTLTDSITTVAGDYIGGSTSDGIPATSAALGGPSSIALDSAGNIYIAEGGYNKIHKVNISTGIITTVAGNGHSGFSGDGGPATNAELEVPLGVTLDDTSNIYITDAENNRVREVVQRLTGIQGIIRPQSVNVSPNPSNGDLTFNVQGVNESMNLDIYTILGEKIIQRTSIMNDPFTIDLKSQPNGVYLYYLYSDKNEIITIGKLIIDHQ